MAVQSDVIEKQERPDLDLKIASQVKRVSQAHSIARNYLLAAPAL